MPPAASSFFASGTPSTYSALSHSRLAATPEVTDGFAKELEIIGVGYRAEAPGNGDTLDGFVESMMVAPTLAPMGNLALFSPPTDQ